MSYALYSSSGSRGSPERGGVGGGGGMIFLSRAAWVPGEGVTPDTSLSGSVCMSSAAGPGREGAGLGPALKDRVVPDFSESCLSVIAASVSSIALPGPSCWRSTEPADRVCIAARVKN